MLPRVNLIRTDQADYLLFSTSDAISTTIYTNGAWAQLMVDISATFCSDIKDPFILDIGANLGAYSVPLAKKLLPSHGFIYAYEPQRIVFYQLCGNIILNRLDNVHAFHSAIGSETSTIDIPEVDYSRTSNIGGFTLDRTIRPESNFLITKDDHHSISVQRLDDLALPAAPSLIKIDVEGHELDVMTGAVQLLRNSNYPPLLLEAWTEDWFAEKRQALIAFVTGLGYTCFFLSDEIIAQHDQHHRQFEFGINDAGGLNMHRIR